VKNQTLIDDPNVKIPAAVKAAAARSEQMFNQFRDQPITSEGNEPAEAQPPQDQEAQPQEQPAEPPLTATQPVAPAAPADDETWEHKYKSIHGRFQKAQDQMRGMADEIKNLQNIIATMQTAPSNAPTPPELQAERLITDDEARDYGEDFLKVVGKKAKEELVPIIKAQAEQIEELKRMVSGVSSVVQQDSTDKMLTTLDEKLPEWRELNTNQEFLSWLRLPDPFSGAIRHEMLKAAYTQGNASRVLAFFNGFLAEEAAVAPAKAEPDTGTRRVPKVPLESLAAPGRAKSAAGNAAPAEKPSFTRANIAAFYADVAAGRYRGREAEKGKIEAQIFDAQREGRIR
jgi:hypothetical protein